MISTVVQVQLLQHIAVSAMQEDPTVPCVLYKQEARMDSGEVTLGSKGLVSIPCLASMQLSCHRVRAELMKRSCLTVFSQDILLNMTDHEHTNMWVWVKFK